MLHEEMLVERSSDFASFAVFESRDDLIDWSRSGHELQGGIWINPESINVVFAICLRHEVDVRYFTRSIENINIDMDWKILHLGCQQTGTLRSVNINFEEMTSLVMASIFASTI